MVLPEQREQPAITQSDGGRVEAARIDIRGRRPGRASGIEVKGAPFGVDRHGRNQTVEEAAVRDDRSIAQIGMTGRPEIFVRRDGVGLWEGIAVDSGRLIPEPGLVYSGGSPGTIAPDHTAP